ncbi:MAG TPA: methyltransferase domain-containing protein [Gammaproteobacteria bacterium]
MTTILPEAFRAPLPAWRQVLPLAALLLLPALGAGDETVEIEYPADGSVAPYVPTVEEDVELMLDVAGVAPGDYVIDLGSGDGRIAIAAAMRGAFAHGVEIEPELVELARRNARRAGVDARTAFVEGDIFDADIAAASVVTLYLFPDANIALRPKLLAELAPGTRVVSNSFDMGEWLPDVHDTSARSSGGILLWIVPADVAGEWSIEIDGDGDGRAPERHTLRVAQRFQQIELTLARADGARTTIADATLRGDRIAFRAVAGARTYAFSGRIDGDSIDGYVQVGDDAGTVVRRWRAAR